ncbi:serine hydrolase [Chitinophaga sp. 22536]|uniref:serine hydrolase n=1 Tax=unclassified Chitinophaga TaxID=2619133 RepID=UPI003F833562
MKINILKHCSLLLACGLCLSVVARSQSASSKGFDRQVHRMMWEAGVPALSLAVIRDGRLAFYKNFECRPLNGNRRINDETIFEAGSLSKSFLVFVVNRLIDKGVLQSDTPLCRYLEYDMLKHDNRYRLITARMVLSHCSGIENWKPDNNPDTLEIMADPGTKFVYSGEGYQYLAEVVKKLLGQSYDEYISKMIISPLHLKHTYTSYKTQPLNYAVGHNSLGVAYKKWKNEGPVPAGGMHLTAADYAKLVIALFDGKNISADRVREIQTPRIGLDPHNPAYCYGPGFELIITPGDTILSHGGITPGFKNLMFYSVKKKCGFVMLTNSDRGTVMARRINELTTGLDLSAFFRSEYVVGQYPSHTIRLLQLYRKRGVAEMFKGIGQLKATADSITRCKTLNELGYIFVEGNSEVAEKILLDNIRLSPSSSLAYYLLGHAQMALQKYAPAFNNLEHSKELGFDLEPVEPYLKLCREELQKKEPAVK